MPKPKLADLSPSQVIEVQDALLANADRLLTAAYSVLDHGNVGLARSLAILGMEESGKAIAIHERRVQMAYAPEGEPFVDDRLADLWASHPKKLRLVHAFLVREQYSFGGEAADPQANHHYLGVIERWAHGHNTLKQRGFYVDVGDNGEVLTPADVSDEQSLGDVIDHVHQIGWQLRLGEHIEATGQAEKERGRPPATEVEVAHMKESLARMDNDDFISHLIESMREGVPGEPLNNDAYRLKIPDPDSNPFANMGRPGYEAETRELLRLHDELDGHTATTIRPEDCERRGCASCGCSGAER